MEPAEGALTEGGQNVEEDRQEPYVGPRTFERKHANRFFGRDREARELISRIITGRVVIFRAPSGAGKSSLLNTRILPGLEGNKLEVLPVGRVKGHAGVEVGAKNVFIYNLLDSLLKDAKHPDGLEEMTLTYFLDHLVAENGKYIYHSADPDSAGPRGPHVLVIDQFEEILTTNLANWKHREPFFEQLGEALKKDSRLWLLMAMRQDFVDELSRYLHHLPDGEPIPYSMERLDEDAALDAIQKPVTETGIEREFEEGAAELLRDRLMTKDLEEGRYDTEFIEPLQLQTVCYQMWKQLKPGSTITREDVNKFAKISEALGKFYEETIDEYKKPTDAREEALRNWFGKDLITEDGYRNLVIRGDERTGSLKNADAELLSGSPILHEVSRSGVIWYELVHDRFVEPILASNQVWQAKKQKRQLQNAGVLIVVFILFSLLSAVSSGSMAERNESDLEAAKAEVTSAVKQVATSDAIVATTESEATIAAQEAVFEYALLSAEATVVARSKTSQDLIRKSRMASDSQTRLQYAYDAIMFTLGNDGTFTAEAAGNLYDALTDIPSDLETEILVSHSDPVNSAVFSPDGERILTASDDGTAQLWDTVKKSLVVFKHEGPVKTAVFSPDGKRVLTASYDGTARLWDAEERVEERSEQKDLLLNELTEHGDWVNMAAFSPDGQLIVTASDDGTARLWDSTGQPKTALEHGAPVRLAVFSPDGGRILTAGDDGAARIWDNKGQRLQLIEGHELPIRSAAFSPDGELIVTASDDGAAILWDSSEGRKLEELIGHEAPVSFAGFSPDGKHILTASEDYTARLWDSEGKLIAIFEGHTAPVRTALYSPGGQSIVTAGDDGTVRLWDIAGRPIAVLLAHSGPVNGIALSPDGTRIASASDDETARMARFYPDIDAMVDKAEELLAEE